MCSLYEKGLRQQWERQRKWLGSYKRWRLAKLKTRFSFSAFCGVMKRCSLA